MGADHRACIDVFAFGAFRQRPLEALVLARGTLQLALVLAGFWEERYCMHVMYGLVVIGSTCIHISAPCLVSSLREARPCVVFAPARPELPREAGLLVGSLAVPLPP